MRSVSGQGAMDGQLSTVPLGDGRLAAPAGGAALAGGAQRGRRAAWGGMSVALVSAATFGTSGTFGTSLLATGWTPGTAVLARIVLAALIMTAPAVIALRGRWGLLRRSAPMVATYGLVGVVGCQVGYFNAISRMPVGVALLIEYTGSVMVVAWLWLRHGQRPRRLTVAGAATAIAGLALMVAIGSSAQSSGTAARLGITPAGLAWAGLAGMSVAVYFVISAGPARPSAPGAAAREELPPMALAWAGMWVGAAVLGLLLATGAVPYGASAGDVTLLRHQVPWIVPVTGIAVLSTAAGYSTGIMAARRLGAKLASFIGMAEVLFAVGYAWVLLGQLPSATQFLGGALILAGVTLVKADES